MGACSSGQDVKEQEQADSVESLYNRAADALDAGEYGEATQLFEEVERQYPYSQWATHAQLMAAFSSYEGGRYDAAQLGLDRFIQLHPGHESLAYAYYLKALTYYDQIADVRRDQQITAQALKALDDVLRRFPNSIYARDAKLKQDLTFDHLAGKEMEIGRYYIKRGHVNAAINRFLAVVKNYETTTHVAEALYRLVEAYTTLGLTKEAQRVAAVLGYNYPGSKWYESAYAILDEKQRAKLLEERSYFDRTIDSLLSPDEDEAEEERE